MQCPKCNRDCHNFASIMGHGRKCCPEYIKGEFGGPGMASISELGYIQLRLKAASRPLPEAIADLPEYLDAMFAGTADEYMTKAAAGMVVGMLNEHIKNPPPPPKNIMEVEDVRPDGSTLQRWVMNVGNPIAFPYPLGMEPEPPWERRVRIDGGPWSTVYKVTPAGKELPNDFFLPGER